jgi:hypothetical protein
MLKERKKEKERKRADSQESQVRWRLERERDPNIPTNDSDSTRSALYLDGLMFGGFGVNAFDVLNCD